jgi:hypothetical protein
MRFILSLLVLAFVLATARGADIEVGSGVVTTGAVNVYGNMPSPTTPVMIFACTQPEGATGIAVEVSRLGFFTWWRVMYSEGCSGWSFSNYLAPRTIGGSVLSYGAVIGACGDAAAISANNRSIQAALDSGGSDVYFPPGNYPFDVLGFQIKTRGQRVHGAACIGTGTAAPSCPSSIQDCSTPLTEVTDVIATGDGTTGPYTANLSHGGVNPGSDIITIPGNVSGYDNTSLYSNDGLYANDGHLMGGCAQGFLDWVTGAITCTTVNPVPVGQPITVTYQWSSFKTICGDVDFCGYLTVRAPHVEIDDLMIQGNQPRALDPRLSLQTATHKAVFGNGAGNDNLYVHDIYATKISGEVIYSDASGPNTRFIHNTITDSVKVALNTNNGYMSNVQIADNMVVNVAACILTAAHDVYVLRNTCRGVSGSFPGGSDAITIWPINDFHVVAFNTVDHWNSANTATSPLIVASSSSGVVAYNTITNNLQYGIPAQGAALIINNGYGVEVVAFNEVKNNGVAGTKNPGILVRGPNSIGPGPLLISDNALDGTADDENVGIEVYADVPVVNQIQINDSNTFGAIPTPKKFTIAPSGAAMDVFQPVIQRALPFLLRGLSVSVK